jgi:hypothetical protein
MVDRERRLIALLSPGRSSDVLSTGIADDTGQWRELTPAERLDEAAFSSA